MDTMIGVDLAKSVFQLHGASMLGEVRFRKKLTRPQFERFMAGHAPACVVMEACVGAHFWARRMQEMDHEVRLIAPQYVRSFVKQQKNDAADAEAIVIAAQRPEMRFVEPKSIDQQARATLFRDRERLVRQRTELINALRGILYEHGYVFPTGARNLGRIGKISKAGQGGIRRLLIMGAMTRLTPRGGLGIPPGSWLARMLERKPKMLVAIALANKMARQIWALLTKQEDYREPAQLTA